MRPINDGEAKALWLRLCEGRSVLDEDGNECPVPRERERKAKAAAERSPPPSWEALRGRGFVIPDEGDLGTPGMRPAAPEPNGDASERADRIRSEQVIADILHGREADRRALPCYPEDPTWNPAGSDREAARACQAVGAYRTCQWPIHAPRLCPRGRIDLAYEETAYRLRSAGVPADFADRVLASLLGHRQEGGRVAPVDLEPRPALAVVRAWVDRERTLTVPGVLDVPFSGETILGLSGELRCGKSLGVAWALSRIGGRWTSATGIASVPFEDWPDRLAEMMTAQLLVIDEIGLEPLTAQSRSRIHDVIAGRHAEKRRTVFTCNLSRRPGPGVCEEDSFAGRYDQRLDRRITESGRFLRLGKWEGA